MELEGGLNHFTEGIAKGQSCSTDKIVCPFVFLSDCHFRGPQVMVAPWISNPCELKLMSLINSFKNYKTKPQ